MAWNSEIALPNCLRCFRIMQRGVERTLRHADAESGDADTSTVENLHCVDEAMAQLAQKIVLGNPAVFKDHGRGAAGAQTEFVFFLPG